VLEEVDVLLATVNLLRERVEACPAPIATEGVALYRAIGSLASFGAFDEKDYFLGETALLAGIGFRLTGNREAAEVWLDRAEAGFRHTLNPSPLLSNITYQRLALRCEMGRFDEVIELVPLLARTFERLKMAHERAKCWFLEAAALRQAGRSDDAVERLTRITQTSDGQHPELRGMAYSHLADIEACTGNDDAATRYYEAAIPLLVAGRKPAAVAHLKSVIAEIFERRGNFQAAIAAYDESISDYAALGMQTWVAHIRLFLAHALLLAGRGREAEWQVLAAMPTIDGEKMIPEGMAAVTLLAESARQRKIDQGALAQVRGYLKGSR
jgi:tetratricopeptide (TPR) repeat protein